VTIYLVLWSALYCLVGAVAIRAIPHRVAAMLGIVAFGFFAIVRGNVGTDTVGVYQSMARTLSSGGFGANNLEPGFRALLYGLVRWTGSPQLAVSGIALVFTALLLAFAVRAYKAESWYLFALFIPALFFQLGFNGERIGIACAVLLLSAQCYRLGQTRLSTVLFWGSLLFQYSSLVVLAYTLLVESKMRTRRFILTAVATLCAITVFAYFAHAYVLAKYTLYVLSGYQSPGPLSGLSQIAIVAIILAGLRYFRLEPQARRRTLWVTTALCATFWGISQYSYAGLRLLDLVAFALPYSLLRAMAKGDAMFTSRAKLVFVLAGFVGAVFYFRNMLLEPAGAQSPFIPYHFIWQ